MPINLNRIVLLVSGALPLLFYRQHQFLQENHYDCLLSAFLSLTLFSSFYAVTHLFFSFTSIFFSCSSMVLMSFPCSSQFQRYFRRCCFPFQCLVAGLFPSQRYQSYSTINLQLASYKLCHNLQQVKRQRNRFDKYKVEKN